MSDPKDKEGETLKRVLQYSGMGIQMVVIILGFMWLGTRLDGEGDGVMVWTLVFTLIGVFVALYLLIRSFLRL